MQPVITVPTIVLHGDSDGVPPPVSLEPTTRFFSGPVTSAGDTGCETFPSPRGPEEVVRAVQGARCTMI